LIYCKVQRIFANSILKNIMKKGFVFFALIGILSCKQKQAPKPSAQDIVDRSIEVSGGKLYTTSDISFDFRKRKYRLERVNNRKALKRILKTDTSEIVDIKTNHDFQRFINGNQVKLHDSMANKYANSVNSVHYFAYLPYGLNDPAVKKEYLGDISINEKSYHKIKVTFNQENGGDDFEDVFIYWFNYETFKPDYIAYEFEEDDGSRGLRLRKAYNERTVRGIRFVDYENLKPSEKGQSLYKLDSLFMKGRLKLLSTIKLKNIVVNPDNYN
jgi:uncharacterized protein DUF6503